jgi:hypothetical protein
MQQYDPSKNYFSFKWMRPDEVHPSKRFENVKATHQAMLNGQQYRRGFAV